MIVIALLHFSNRTANISRMLFRSILSISCLSLCIALPCSDSIYTPIDYPGPPLSVPIEHLSKALTCSALLNSSFSNDIGFVLFIPGTGVEKAMDQYGHAWTLELDHYHRRYCLIDPPDFGLGDIQVSGEYIVYAIRTVYKQSNHHRVNIIAHSQGSATARWALRFWPDTRAMVENLIGLAPANHALDQDRTECSLSPCIPARWQFLKDSRAMCALNSYQETFPDQIAYTQILTRYDQAIRPINASELNSGTNIYVQDLCPLNRIDHLGLAIYDFIAFLIAMDAIQHDGSASLTRIQQTSCVNQSCCKQPYIDSFNQSAVYNVINDAFGLNSFVENYPKSTVEPKLKCYVIKQCAMKYDSSLPSH